MNVHLCYATFTRFYRQINKGNKIMYREIILAEGEENKRKGMLISVALHLLLLLLCLFPYFYNNSTPDTELSGILVQLGEFDPGNSENIAAVSAEEVSEEETATSESEVSESAEKQSTESEAPALEEQESPSEDVKVEVAPTEQIVAETREDVSEVIAATKAKKKKLEEEAKKREAKAKAAAKAKKEAAAKAATEKAEAEAEAKRKAEEEAAKKAKYDAQKSKFGSLLSGGAGNSDQSGSEGSPDGDPNSNALKNLATGSGAVGDGLSDRAILFTPEITDNSQKTGRVVVDICIDASGKVTTAKYTQRGSTTSDKDLIDVAVDGVKQYRFSTSQAKKQCGSVIIDFKLK